MIYATLLRWCPTITNLTETKAEGLNEQWRFHDTVNYLIDKTARK